MSVNARHLDNSNWLGLSGALWPPGGSPKKVLTVFGTRPEAIKMSSVIQNLQAHSLYFKTVNVVSGQHTDLLYPLLSLFDISIDYDLRAMQPDQTPNQLCSRLISSLDSILRQEQPDLLLVQGDTTTALAGALAGFHHRIPVVHVEAGLRSGNIHSPYPEEMNRRLITSLASYHFAATPGNRETLLAEGVADENIFVTGNPVVDALNSVLTRGRMSASLEALLATTQNFRRVVLTTHRRESFGRLMMENLRAIRRFTETHADVALIFPVHLNPSVTSAARDCLSGHERIHLIEPLDYEDFIALLAHAWLLVSDSGGVQEEAPTLGKPLLILRENTERPEVVEAGIARLVGGQPAQLLLMLEEAYAKGGWTERVEGIENPFGRGDSGRRITQVVAAILQASVSPSLSLSQR